MSNKKKHRYTKIEYIDTDTILKNLVNDDSVKYHLIKRLCKAYNLQDTKINELRNLIEDYLIEKMKPTLLLLIDLFLFAHC